MDEARLVPGARVMTRGRSWTVRSRTAFSACAALRLVLMRTALDSELTLLAPFDRIQPLDPPVDERPRAVVVRPRRWMHTVHRLCAESHPFGRLAAAATARVDILPYQLEPALAVARGTTRVMIADGVGLGKTIQAGLFLNELSARSDTFRALIAAPAGLRDQWSAELNAHFGLRTTVSDAAWLTRMARDLPADVSPWALPGIYIASYDFLKQPVVLQPLEDAIWDALVVDEAHNASMGTARRAAIDAIARRGRHVILLTATPHAGDAEQFESLCRLGDTASPPDRITIFRRTRADVSRDRPRRSVILAVRLTAAERRMHRLLDAYATRVCREAAIRGDARAPLAAIALRKRALSSAASLAASVQRRRHLLAGLVVEPEQQLDLPLWPEEEADDRAPDGVLSAPGLASAIDEHAALARIAAAADKARTAESKERALLRFLSRAREPAIVFTEYRDTLERLEARVVSHGFRPLVLHGGLPPVDRAAVQRTFNRSGGVLLATDAAAEGLNLHSQCRLVVHYELPWSPSRLEQRTGRVDRIGQQRRVHEVLIVARDTAERLVLAPLARRGAQARAAISGSSRLVEVLSESRVAEAVMNGVPIADAQPPAASLSHWVEPAADIAAVATDEGTRLSRLRARHRASGRDEPGGRRGCVVSVSRKTPGRGLLCLYRLMLTTVGGSVVHAETIAVEDQRAAMPASRSALDCRRAFETWLASHEAVVRATVWNHVGGTIRTVAALHQSAETTRLGREEMITRARPSTARELIQAGLFDGRALRSHQSRRRVESSLLNQLTADAGRLAPLTPIVELCALLYRAAERR